jgi:molybdopterin-guanine dinucleotide biosynthesis protein A
VLAGLDWAAGEGAEAIVTAAADTPFFPRDLVAGLRLAREAAGTPLAMAMSPGAEGRLDRHPTFGLWPVALREDLRSALAAGTRKVVEWTEPLGCARAIFHDRGEPFFNVNTPGDLARAEALAESARA